MQRVNRTKDSHEVPLVDSSRSLSGAAVWVPQGWDKLMVTGTFDGHVYIHPSPSRDVKENRRYDGRTLT